MRATRPFCVAGIALMMVAQAAAAGAEPSQLSPGELIFGAVLPQDEPAPTAAPATIEEATTIEDDRGAWYVRIGADYIVNHDATLEFAGWTGTVNGTDALGIRGGVGVRLNKFLSLELDLGYTSLEYDPVSYSGFFLGNLYSGSVTGDLDYFTTMFGPRLDIELFDGFSLNGTAMIGFAYASGSINGTETYLGTTYSVSGTGDAAAVAYGFRGGVEWSFSRNVAIYAGIRFEGSSDLNFNYNLYTNTADAILSPMMLGVDFGVSITF